MQKNNDFISRIIKKGKMSQITSDNYSFNNYIDNKRWMSYFYQLKYCMESDKEDILIIGKGDGVLETLLKHYKSGCLVTTFDYAEDLNPDICGNVLNLSSYFYNNKFSVVVCCQVLEHLPFDDFVLALDEIKKVLDRNGVLILSLPDSGICPDINIHIPKIGDYRWFIKICKIYKKEFSFDGQHYWEINSARKYCLKKVIKNIKQKFDIVEEFLVPLNTFHRFFICKIRK